MKWIARLRLVDDARHAWKWASINITVVSSALMSAWLAMPADVRERMPAWLPLVLGGLTIAGRLSTMQLKETSDGE